MQTPPPSLTALMARAVSELRAAAADPSRRRGPAVIGMALALAAFAAQLFFGHGLVSAIFGSLGIGLSWLFCTAAMYYFLLQRRTLGHWQKALGPAVSPSLLASAAFAAILNLFLLLYGLLSAAIR